MSMCSEDIYDQIIPYDPSIHPRKNKCPIRLKDTETFKMKVEWIHGTGRFDLSNSIYTGSTNEVVIRCLACNAILRVIPKSFIANRSSCSSCNGGVRKDGEEYIKLLAEKHPSLDFSKSLYKGAREKILVTCP